MPEKNSDTDLINLLLTDMLEALLDRHYPAWVRRGTSAFPIPNSDSDLGSFEVYLRPKGKNKRGDWFRRSENIGGGAIQLLAYALTGNHKAYREAYAEAREFLGLTEMSEEAKKKLEAKKPWLTSIAIERRKKETYETERRAKLKQANAKTIWRMASPISGTPAEAYLRGRGLVFLVSCGSLRYAELPYPFHDASVAPTFYPTLVCAVANVEMRLTAVWRIFLQENSDGVVKKADVANPKLGLGPSAGGAVWLQKPAETINVCEGVETALAIRGLTGGESVAAALSTSGLMNFKPPPLVKKVHIWPDPDRDKIRIIRGAKRIQESPGLVAASALASRLKDGGLSVSIQPSPKNGLDFLDVWNGGVRK